MKEKRMKEKDIVLMECRNDVSNDVQKASNRVDRLIDKVISKMEYPNSATFKYLVASRVLNASIASTLVTYKTELLCNEAIEHTKFWKMLEEDSSDE